jgi:hypothetical protein
VFPNISTKAKTQLYVKKKQWEWPVFNLWNKLDLFLRMQNNFIEIQKNTYRLIYGHFHIDLVIIPIPPYWPETQSRVNMGRGMITRPIWKCPCIKLVYFRSYKNAFILTKYVIKYIMHILGLYSCIHFVFPTLKLQYADWNRYPEEAVLNLNSSRYLHVYLQQTSNFSLWNRNWETQHQP